LEVIKMANEIYDWLHNLPTPCPYCGVIPPTYLIGAISNKPVIACMNITCKNMRQFEDDTLLGAIGKWSAWAINEK